MFDEKSKKWIQIYRVVTIILFFLIITVSFVGGFLYRLFTGLITGYGMARGLGYVLGKWILLGIAEGLLGSIIAFVLLVINMLIIQLLNNVQIIRENIEKK